MGHEECSKSAGMVHLGLNQRAGPTALGFGPKASSFVLPAEARVLLDSLLGP